MDVLCDDILPLVCQYLVLQSEFNFLMVNKDLRLFTQMQISRELETVTHIVSKRLHNLCLRASTCLPLIRLKKCTQRNRIVTYRGDQLRSNIRFVLAQWNYIDTQRCLLLSKKRVNSIMFNHQARGVNWDLDIRDNFKKPPDILLFIRSPTTSTGSSH
jgi:hypothetical protein